MSVRMCDGLELEKFFAQGAQVDVEGSCWGWALWEGEGEELVVVFRRGAGRGGNGF